jgi:YidC/Oxa1 family membrane protein insertase
MPVFIALFNAISHFIQLRGQTFLWIKDLSSPDRLATLPFSIPILGQELNALPIIMAFAMFIQTKMSQQQMPSTDTNPMASAMSGPMMPILFGVMFYHIPSGLVLYWLSNSIISLMIYRFAK